MGSCYVFDDTGLEHNEPSNTKSMFWLAITGPVIRLDHELEGRVSMIKQIARRHSIRRHQEELFFTKISQFINAIQQHPPLHIQPTFIDKTNKQNIDPLWQSNKHKQLKIQTEQESTQRLATAFSCSSTTHTCRKQHIPNKPPRQKEKILFNNLNNPPHKPLQP